ncbi:MULTISPECIES: DUF2536 family protein [Bacillus]|uniref:DUF2536 family protein n=1 Tax=Bacillus TaxID=1386 RepID=UPI000BB8DDD0|nr:MULTISPECIES: DUF2536 family protein [Bacillus]
MNLDFQLLEDKVEFFEATSLKILQQKINEQIEHNRAILLSVHSVSHQMHVSEEGRTYYSAVVHFKLKKG